MVEIFWFQLCVMLSALAWDVWHWITALNYDKELKWKGASFLERTRDPQWRENWHAALQDTGYSIGVSWVCEMIMPYMVGATVGMVIGLLFSITQRRQAKRRKQMGFATAR